MAKKPSKPTKPEASVAEQLHDALGLELLKRVRTGRATAADLSVARQFLRDNGVEARKPGEHEVLQGLADTLPFEAAGNDQ